MNKIKYEVYVELLERYHNLSNLISTQYESIIMGNYPIDVQKKLLEKIDIDKKELDILNEKITSYKMSE